MLGLALSAALVAETFVVTSEAYAAPATETAPAETTAGALEAPDIATARTIARLQGERVEVIGERTETSSTWALPDGSMTTGLAAAPVWVRTGNGDGTEAADWAPVDLTLELGSDGEVRPKAHPAGLVLAGAGLPEDGRLLSMGSPSGATVGLGWTAELPAPRLEGPRAVYPGVQPGVDLVVEATRTGYEQFFVLTQRPADGAAPNLSLTVTGEGVAAAAAADGGVTFSTPAGKAVGSTATPMVWDAALDAERLHPITKPWAAAGETPGKALAPLPAWATQSPPSTWVEPPARTPHPDPAPDGIAPPQSPATDPGPGPDAGRAASAEASAAGGSPALPLPQAAVVTAPDRVDLALTPDAGFLADPDTTYPVVVDPALDWQWGFDTWVQSGYSSDQSGSTELRLGTFDGGVSVARSFVHLDLSRLQGKLILEAELYLWEWHAYSCEPRNWEVWDTGLASTSTRIDNQPPWYGRWSTSPETTGAAACADGWVTADVKNLIQSWANHNATWVSMGLKAENEADSYGWKKFNSANAGGNIPTTYIRWNDRPATPDMLRVLPEPSPLVASTSSTTPRLSARVQDSDGAADLLFRVELEDTTTFDLWDWDVPSGTSGWVDIPAGKLTNGSKFRFFTAAHDKLQYSALDSVTTPWWTVDTSAPAAPSVASTDYPADGGWHGDKDVAGSFTLTMPAADPTLAAFEWDLDKTPQTRLNNTTGTATISATPTTAGRHVLYVRSVDAAGNRSPIASHVFYVGRAGLTSPLEGSQVVRRVRLTTQADPEFTHVKFAWRRGPDGGSGQDISLPTLTRADGQPLTSTWTSLTDLGEYATWDAGATLGDVPGPVQVQAITATDAQGTGAYPTGWVTVTVSPEAQHAATDSVGPGSVNLLTGDYRLSSTDVEEFGLSVARTASSRSPRAGLAPQKELLTLAQRTISDPLTGFYAHNSVIARATNVWHGNNDSLKITSTAGSTENFAYPGAQYSGDIKMVAGKTYRISGWVYVPASNGLVEGSPDAPRIAAYSRAPDNTYPSVVSNRVSKSDTWQQLSLEFTVPPDHTAPFIRLYNGFTATDAAVYYDDLSVTEVWSALGPQWSLGAADSAAGTAYSHISQPYPDVAGLHMAGGGEIWFTGGGASGRWWPQPGAESLTLVVVGPGHWRLTELDGTVSEFVVQPGANTASWVTTAPPAASGSTRLVYQNVDGRMQLHRMIAPVEPGVDGWPTNTGACTGSTPAVGCEVLELVYSTPATATVTATSFGSYGDRLAEIRLWSAPTATATSTDSVVAVRYAYDDKGQLRQVWDPRITPEPLKTGYDYDADGRVLGLIPPGELPWRFSYGTGGANSTVGSGDLLDRSSGRLLSVSRASLVPGTVDQIGPDTTSTMVYAVPTTRAAGGPHDLDAAAIGTWGQRSAPTDATAIFGPEDVPSVTTATATSPGPDGYRAATVHYLDSSGREVNTATPAGPDAPAAGFIDTAEHDGYGNVVRSLDATNRLLALGQLPSAADDLTALNLTQTDTATRAMALSSLSTYGPEGLDLLRSRGPLLRLAVGNDPANVQLVHDLTTYAYDEGKPDGLAYHLVTTQTDALLIAGTSPEQLADAVVTKNGYAPIDGADPLGKTSGWKIGSPTTVTADAGTGGAAITAKIRYNDHGKVVESRKAGSTGTDAGTSRAVYYTAGTNPERAECGNTPAYAGLPCMNYAAGAVTGHDTARMATELPVRTITAYNRYGSVASVTESATGPVAGVTVTQTRTTAAEYDPADRVLSVTLSGQNAGAAVAKTVHSYDPATGHVTTITGQDATGAAVSTVRKTLDRLGRMTRYEDGNGGVTDSVFDAYGKPTQVTDSIGTTTTFTYDRAIEPRGFVTSVTDSVAGTISAAYGPDGQVTSQALPGGVELRIGYDANRSPITRKYVRTSDSAEIATSAVVDNAAGQWVTHTTVAGSKRYTYDRLQRLTDVQDSVAGLASCTWRSYDHNDRAGRTAMATSVSPTTTCADPADPASPSVTKVGYTYDTADRLVTESTVDAGAWVYDPLGRITTAPVRGSPGTTVANAFYANDLVASQTIEGVARQSWSLDALGRFSSYTNEAWAAGADGVPAWQQAVTKVNHYDSDSDSPAWIAEDASLPNEISRYVDGLDGSMAMQTGKTGGRVLQLIDLHGDVMTTLPIRDGETVADWAALKHQAADEFGNPTDLTTGTVKATTGASPGKDGRYGWLGGAQRSADALAGVLLMGVRLYDPGTGRFWSVDPVPGGNATTYDYCSADPVNCTDLDGRWSMGGMLKGVAKFAEVASNIPGPIGSLSAAVSAGAYAATGNRSKAIMMGVTIAAAMVPGGGAAVKLGFAAARAGGRVAAKVGQAINKLRKGRCNSFTPETRVLMADGSTRAISDIEVGDLVAALDPMTGELTAQPVLNVIVGVGEKHLIGVSTSRAPAGSQAKNDPAPGLESDDFWVATANHPIWVDGDGWTDAQDLEVGDLTVGVAGSMRVVVGAVDHGWLRGQTVYNLTVANIHTFVVGRVADGVVVHNSSDCQVAQNYKKGKAFENQIADQIRASVPGVVVRQNVFYGNKLLGRRFLDVVVYSNGRPILGIEAKTGKSRYRGTLQHLKDRVISRRHKFPIIELRG